MKTLVILALACALCACGPTGHGSASSPSLRYRQVWKATLDENADSRPVIVRRVAVAHHGKPQSIVVVLAGNNDSDCEPGNLVRESTTYAFLARTGRLLWQRSTRGRSRCTTATPAVAGGWVYSSGLDGRVHRYALSTGREFSGHGWPERFTRNSWYEKSSGGLRILGHYLYVPVSGYTGHPGTYDGHLVTIDLLTGRETVWNSVCSNVRHLLNPTPKQAPYCRFDESGIWGREGVERDPSNGNIVLATGDGPWNGRTNWGDSIVELSKGGAKLLGSFTPENQAYLAQWDLDLGSTTPALLPPVRWRGRTLRLALQAGKAPAGSNGGPEVVWLLNQRLWAGTTPPGRLGGQIETVNSPFSCAVLTAPAIWRGPRGKVLTIIADDCGVAAYRVEFDGRRPRAVVQWRFAGVHFTSPIIANGILYIAHSGGLAAYNPRTGRRLWSSTQPGSGGSIGNVHWEYPAVAGRMLFMTDERSRLYAYKRMSH